MRLRLDFLVVLECKLFNMEFRLFSISLVVVLFGDFVVRGGVGRHSIELEVLQVWKRTLQVWRRSGELWGGL